MGLFNIFKDKKSNEDFLKPQEKEVLNLLMAGEHPTLNGLRRQLNSNFILRVERSHSQVSCISGISKSIEKSRYQIHFILPYEKSMSYTVGKEINFRLDDLVVTNQSDGRKIYFDLVIHEGEMSILLGVVSEGVFPFDFKVGDWNYKRYDDNGKIILSKERDLTKIPTQKKQELPLELTEFQKWLLSLKDEILPGLKEETLTLKLSSPVNLASIETFEKEYGFSLPNDYREFLAVTNGCNFFGVDLQSIDDCFRVDAPQLSQFVPFHTWIDGNFSVFNVEEHFSVYYLSHDPLGYARIANSFQEWLRKVEAEIRSERQLYHPSDQKAGSIYGQVLMEMKRA
jgi:hypothetical protein